MFVIRWEYLVSVSAAKICPTKAISLEEEGDGKKDFSDGVNGALLW
jgi:hypothetical protein